MNEAFRKESGARSAAFVAGATLTVSLAVMLGACSGASDSLSLAGSAATDAAPGDALPPADAGRDQGAEAQAPEASLDHDAMEPVDGGGWTDASIPESSAADAADVATPEASGADSGQAEAAAPVPTPIAFVQIATATVNGTSHVTATFLEAPRAGDLVVVAVGTTDTGAMVTSVSDTAGNPYALAIGPTIQTTNLAQYIFYASNIVAGGAPHQVTVKYNEIGSSSDVVDMRVAEYSGLSPVAPLDVTAEATGDSIGASCGPVGTTSPRELLFAAGMSLDLFTTAGAGFNLRAISVDGDLAEDQVLSTAGSVSAAARLQGSSAWVLQLAAFR